MPRIVLPDGRVIVVPDDATPEELDQIANEAMPAESAPESKGSMTSSLPMIGGMAGSLLGGSKMSPVGMALAGVGGAAGEAYRQVADSVRGDFSDVPDSVMGRLQRIGTEGLKQAGMEGAGRVAGKVIQPVAKTLYGMALRPAKAIARDVGGGKLVQGIRRIVDQGFADNVMPSGLGVSRARDLVSRSANDATTIAARSPAKAVTARVMQKATDDQSKRSAKELVTTGIAPKVDQIAEQMGRVVDANPAELSMNRLLEIRRGAEDVAAPVFKAAKLPGGAGRVAPGSEASVARSISGAAKQTLDDVLGEPFKAVNRRTQARMAVKQSVDDAAARPNMLMNLLAGSVGVASSGGDPMEAAKNGLLLRLIFSPTVMGAGALAVGKAPYSQLFRAGQFAREQE